MRLEKEEVRIITEKFKEKKKEQGTSLSHKKVKDNSGQTKKNFQAGDDGNFKSQRIYKTRPNNNVSEKSDNEQFYDTRDGLTDQKEILNDKIDDFNKLNEVLSDRIKEINDNKPTGKVLKETKDGDNTNENKKRVAQIQGSRGDDNSEGSE
ncbi:hypothetical protein RhiirA1_402747 [Rhizophagus irregularis]|uniref:Uncharacterized protein n=1 Tax=Rhizophagus irregularis TaxID=588596 RepID=A0A2I1F0U1_9GLOM|nr:hypothetical protein RhiirA1_402747 [Rhizophagus irregularis]PKY27988.1 hypothetical protein RhiirB3_390712 [Rhizophagus irregularis]